jgi:hypothetical protein
MGQDHRFVAGYLASALKGSDSAVPALIDRRIARYVARSA